MTEAYRSEARANRFELLQWLILATVAFALTVHGFSNPWGADDLFVTGALDGTSPWSPSRFDLYRFSSGIPAEVGSFIHRGVMPWWTLPDWKYALWRPLTSAMLVAEHAFFGMNRLGYQTVSSIWYVLCVLSAHLFFRLTLPRRIAFVASLLFALNGVHVPLVFWIVAVHHVVGFAIGLAAVSAYVCFREGRFRFAEPIAWSLLTIALLGGESAFGVAGYFLAFELSGMRLQQARDRIRAIGPVLLIFVAYFVVHAALGHGLHGEGVHGSLFDNPRRFVINAVIRTFVQSYKLLSGASPTQNETAFSLNQSMQLAVVALTAALWLMSRRHFEPRERALIRFFLLGAVLSLLPAIATEITFRTLLGPSLGVCAFLAILLSRAFAIVRAPSAASLARRIPMAALIGVLVLAHTLAQLPSFLEVRPPVPLLMSAEPKGSDTDVVVLGGGGFQFGVLGGYIRERAGRGHVRHWYTLSSADGKHTIFRKTPTRIIIKKPPEDGFFRSRDFPMHVGERVSVNDYDVTVLEATRGIPTEIAVDFRKDLDDPSLYFLRIDFEPEPTIEKVDIPPVGKSIEFGMDFPELPYVDRLIFDQW